MKKVLICSPIRRKSAILKEFLDGLERLDLKGVQTEYYFIDDNDDPASTELLEVFAKKHRSTYLRPASDLVGENINFGFHKNGLHAWNTALVNRIIAIKDDMFKYAKKISADYAFFVDSDIIMHPETIKHLINRNVDIVSEIFWTEWVPGQLYSPNAWLQDEISPFKNPNQQHYDEWQIKRFTASFYNMLKVPGIYEVGGLGACTLISKHAIDKGVSFALVDNVSFWGEDRHFCIRARALGLKLHIDTVYPAYHIYRDDLLAGVPNFIKNGFSINQTSFNTKTSSPNLVSKIFNRIGRSFGNFFRSIGKKIKDFTRWSKHLYLDMKRLKFAKKRRVRSNPKLTLSMIVKNESGRYLEQVLQTVKPYIDNAVIIDDGSTDNTVEICKRELKGVKHTIIENKASTFATGAKLRKQQWQETIKTNPDWILLLDADEAPENKFATEVKNLMNNLDVDAYGFQFSARREIEYFLVRYQPKLHYKFNRRNRQAKRYPDNLLDMVTYCDYPTQIISYKK